MSNGILEKGWLNLTQKTINVHKVKELSKYKEGPDNVCTKKSMFVNFCKESSSSTIKVKDLKSVDELSDRGGFSFILKCRIFNLFKKLLSFPFKTTVFNFIT